MLLEGVGSLEVQNLCDELLCCPALLLAILWLALGLLWLFQGIPWLFLGADVAVVLAEKVLDILDIDLLWVDAEDIPAIARGGR